MPQIPSKALDIIVCPHCRGRLAKSNTQGLFCSSCNVSYENTESGSLDLRLKTIKQIQLNFQIGKPLDFNYPLIVEPLSLNKVPQVDFNNVPIPVHLTRELMSYFPKATEQNSLMLDLGCGPTIPKEVYSRTGFEYVGLDYNDPRAPILGDAHSLPFQDKSFDFILSLAVLEHLQFPFVGAYEIYRVLKPGGTFIGTLAFLEPFHMDSFYHYTHLGTYNILRHAGFEVQWIAPDVDWSVFTAQAMMPEGRERLFPRLPGSMSKFIILLPDRLSNLWWKIKGKKKIQYPITGGFFFMAKRGFEKY